MAEEAFDLRRELEDTDTDDMNALEKGEKSAGDIQEVRGIKQRLLEDLLQAGSIFNKEDRDRWKRRIVDSAKKSDAQSLQQISDQIAEERKEIGNITQGYIAEIDQNQKYFGKTKEHDTAKEFIDNFMKADVEGKRKLKAGLKKEIEDRVELYEDLLKLAPDLEDEFSTMRRSEKAKLREELQKAQKPHEKLKEEFEAFPIEYRIGLGDKFRKGNIKEKEKAVEDLTAKLIKDYKKKLGATKALSPNEIKENLAYINNPNVPITGPLSGPPYGGKINAFKTLDAHIKLAEEKTKEFDELAKDLPTAAEHPTGKDLKGEYELRFRNSNYTKKVELCTKLKGKIESMEDGVTEQYLGLLDEELGEKNISRETHLKYAMGLYGEPLREKMRWLKLFDKEMAPRREVTAKFKQLPKSVQMKNIDFYNLGKDERQKRYKELTGEDLAIKQTPANDQNRSQPEAINTDKGNKESSDQSVNSQKPGNSNKQPEVSDEIIKNLAKQKLQESTMQEAKKRHTVAEELLKADKSAETFDDHKKDATSRTKGLTSEQGELQKELTGHIQQQGHTQKEVLMKNEATGEVEATNVIELRVDKLATMTPEEFLALRKEAAVLQHLESARKPQRGRKVEMRNKDGQTVTAETAQKAVEQQKETTIDAELGKKIGTDLKSKGVKVDDSRVQRVIGAMDEEEFETELQIQK